MSAFASEEGWMERKVGVGRAGQWVCRGSLHSSVRMQFPVFTVETFRKWALTGVHTSAAGSCAPPGGPCRGQDRFGGGSPVGPGPLCSPHALSTVGGGHRHSEH